MTIKTDLELTAIFTRLQTVAPLELTLPEWRELRKEYIKSTDVYLCHLKLGDISYKLKRYFMEQSLPSRVFHVLKADILTASNSERRHKRIIYLNTCIQLLQSTEEDKQHEY